MKLLLADERVHFNQAQKVRVGGEGKGGWRERKGGRRGAVHSAGCVTTEGGRSSHQQGGECEGSRAVHQNRREGASWGRRQCHERMAAREGGGEGGCGAGVEVIGDDDGALVSPSTLRAGAAWRVVRRVGGRR